MKYVVCGLVVALIVLHQDFWFRDDSTLVFGFMPIGLAYHAALSLEAGGVWLLAALFCWPHWVDEEESRLSGDGRPS